MAIRALEDLKDAACAAQAERAVTVVEHEVEQADAEPVPQDVDRQRVVRRRRSLARRSAIAQVALARRESPHCGQVFVGMADVLVREMPHTLAALRTGRLNEFRAKLLVRETACLEKDHRTLVDRELCADPKGLEGVGTKRLVAMAEAAAYRLEPASVVQRAERDAAERNVSLRPAPGAMTYFTALVPLQQGVAMYANLQQTAASARATGDPRSRGQVMADTLVERVTGQATADGVPVTVNLVMSDATLLASGHDPAVMDGGHVVPAQAARELAARAMENLDALAGAVAGNDESPPGELPEPPGAVTSPGLTGTSKSPTSSGSPSSAVGAWVRRLYADAGGNLVGMDSRARLFPQGLASLLRVRDQGLCRTPWCDAPIAHLDHVVPAADGGLTSATNGQGLCAACNYVKEAPGWEQKVPDGEALGAEPARHTVITTTPTGDTYTSTAPPLPAPLQPAAARENASRREGLRDRRRDPRDAGRFCTLKGIDLMHGFHGGGSAVEHVVEVALAHSR
ncbi:MAG: DUF222 domain-containing protein [Actinomycetales bacterium]|nr:DUF222 domain-containing protein [Actinomycetales bacterium]